MIPQINRDGRWRAHDPIMREDRRPEWGPLVGRDSDSRGLRHGRVFADAFPTAPAGGKGDDGRAHDREMSFHGVISFSMRWYVSGTTTIWQIPHGVQRASVGNVVLRHRRPSVTLAPTWARDVTGDVQ